MAKRAQGNYNNDTTPNSLGKIPPQALDFEEAVLAACMLEKEAYPTISEILTPECFYKEAHQKIFQAIIDLFLKEEPLDMITVTQMLRRNGTLEEIGGPVFIARLTENVAAAAHIEFHARIIYEKYIQRELIRVASDIQRKAYDESSDVEELMNEAENGIYQISQQSKGNEVEGINVLLADAIKKIEEAAKNPDHTVGVPSGFEGLDAITSGWQPSDLVIIAARPAMGKTAFILSMARNMAVDHDVPVAVFSLEMSNLQLVQRLIVSETEIEAEKIKRGNLADYEWAQLNRKIKKLENAKIFVDDTPGLSVFDLRAKCRRLASKHGIKIIFIDYLQLMNASGMKPGSREQEVSMISRSLKALAKELNIPVIALSQLNRGVENRTGYEGKRPQLADLRESGAIEQDADMVCFIHRPEYYGITEGPKGEDLIGIAEIIIAKHRNGAVGLVPLRFRPELAKFLNPEKDGRREQTFVSKINPGKPARAIGAQKPASDFPDDPLSGQGFGGDGSNFTF